jgi:AraC family transcriptional regulator
VRAAARTIATDLYLRAPYGGRPASTADKLLIRNKIMDFTPLYTRLYRATPILPSRKRRASAQAFQAMQEDEVHAEQPASRLGEDCGNTRPPVVPSSLAQLVAKMMDDDQESARSLLSRAAALLEPSWPIAAPEPDGIARGGLARWQVRKVSAHIDANLDASIRVAELAAIVRLSTSYFCRAFKKSVGHSPCGHIMKKRIAHARHLMMSTNDSLAQIAVSCGFTDQAHLSRLFLRFVGQPPQAWRRAQSALD